MRKIVLASNNQGKIREFKNIFQKYNVEIIPQQDLEVPDVDEPFYTFIENSLHKARHCAKHTGLPALADDSGLCVTALNGAPGVYSARYAGEPKSDQANIDKLITNMNNINNREAYFYCSLVFIRHEHDPQPIVADGIFYGEIDYIQKGNNGHGYDPIFYIPEYKKTAAEISNEIKNKISHRGKAIQQLQEKLESLKLF